MKNEKEFLEYILSYEILKYEPELKKAVQERIKELEELNEKINLL